MTEENKTNSTYSVTADELRSFVERIEQLNAEKQDIMDQSKEVFSEAKGRGFDVKVLRKLIAMRKKDESELSEEEMILEMYKEALGM